MPDIGTAVVGGLAAAFSAFFTALPAIIGALAILVIGWIVAGWIGGLVVRALRAIRFDAAADRTGATGFLARGGVHARPAEIFGLVVTWYVRLIFLLMAANFIGLTAMSKVVNDVLGLIPNLIVAVVILAAFAWLAGLARTIVRGSAVPSAGLLATLAYVTVFAFGVVAAADQIGVATTLVNTLFIGVVAALALAFGLAFGLGGRDEAAQIWRDVRAQATRVAAAPMRSSTQVTDGTERIRREELLRKS